MKVKPSYFPSLQEKNAQNHNTTKSKPLSQLSVTSVTRNMIFPCSS